LDCFGYGIEYVCLSRVRRLSGLAIIRINDERFIKRVITSPESLKELKITF